MSDPLTILASLFGQNCSPGVTASAYMRHLTYLYKDCCGTDD